MVRSALGKKRKKKKTRKRVGSWQEWKEFAVLGWLVGERHTEKVAFESIWEGNVCCASTLRAGVLERTVALFAPVVNEHLR